MCVKPLGSQGAGGFVHIEFRCKQEHTASMTHRVQRSYGHGWEGKADHLPVPAVCECCSHSPTVEVLRLLQDDTGLRSALVDSRFLFRARSRTL